MRSIFIHYKCVNDGMRAQNVGLTFQFDGVYENNPSLDKEHSTEFELICRIVPDEVQENVMTKHKY